MEEEGEGVYHIWIQMLVLLTPLEVSMLEEIRSLRRSGADEDALAHHLDEFHARMTAFSEDDVEILEEAGLILRPKIEHSAMIPTR